MNKELIRNQIRELLDTVTEQVNALKEFKERIPQIEFDLILENVRNLYEELHLLQRMNDPYEQMSRPAPAHPEPLPEPVPEPGPISDPVIRHAEKTRPSSRREAVSEKKTKPETGIDLFAEEEPTFNIRLQEARDQSLGPISATSEHLKSLIGINDKFIFINELFDGNLREYNETIETLNGFKDHRQALEFVDLFRLKNLWDPASTAFRKLQDVLEKKFA